MEVWVLWSYDDGIIGIYSSEKLAEYERKYNHDNGFYHEEDVMIEKRRVQSEVIDD